MYTMFLNLIQFSPFSQKEDDLDDNGNLMDSHANGSGDGGYDDDDAMNGNVRNECR